MAQDRHKLDADLVKAVFAVQGVALSTPDAAGSIAASLSAAGAAAARAATTRFEAEPANYVVAQLAARGRI